MPPHGETAPGLKPSIINRLIDPASEGTSWRRGYGIEQMVESVQQDLEDLLNTHRTDQDIPEELVEVRNSIVTYGMPDLVSQQSTAPDAGQRVGKAIEEAIARFEPRLSHVHATLIEPKGPHQLRLEFRIQSILRVDPAPEVAFVTVLKLSTGETSIQPVDE